MTIKAFFSLFYFLYPPSKFVGEYSGVVIRCAIYLKVIYIVFLLDLRLIQYYVYLMQSKARYDHRSQTNIAQIFIT